MIAGGLICTSAPSAVRWRRRSVADRVPSGAGLRRRRCRGGRPGGRGRRQGRPAGQGDVDHDGCRRAGADGRPRPRRDGAHPRRNLANRFLVPGRVRVADDDHCHRVRTRVAAAGTSSRRRTASVRIRAEPGATDPAVRRLHADRRVVRRHDDGLHSELLLRAAGAEGPQPLPFALFFASTALAQILLSVVNAKIVGRFRPRT